MTEFRQNLLKRHHKMTLFDQKLNENGQSLLDIAQAWAMIVKMGN
jgi:hypothetical protein